MAPKAKEKPKGASSQPTIAIEDLFASLNKFISRSEYEQAVKVATQVLSTSPGDEDALRCKIVALVKADNIDEAFTVIQSSQKLPIDLSFLKAYCMYRLNKLDEALESLKSQERSTATMLLESQILYRLGRMDACLDIYQKLQNSSVDSLEINFVAGLVGAGRSSEVQRVLENLKIKPTSSFELAYNTACSLIEKNKYVDAEQLLLSARRVGQESLMEENWADDDIENELAPIAVQLAYVQQLLGNTQEAAQAYLELIKHNLADESSLAIATNNLISLRGPKEISDSLKKLDRLIEKGDGGQFQLARVLESKLSVKQKEAVYVNRALLLLHANKIDQVRELVSASVGMFPDSVTPVLLQAAVLVRENKAGRAEEVLGQFAGKYPDKSKIFLLARAQVAAAAGHFQVAAESLSKIPDIQHMPATVATIVALKERFGDIDGAEVVLDNAIKWWSNAMTEDSKLTVIMQEAASFKLKHGRQLPNGVMKASQRDLQALECQLSETLAGNTKSHYTEMICGLGSFGKDLDVTDVEDLQTRTVSSDSGDVPLPRTVIESSSLRRMVESLKDELETMKKEHAGLNDNDAGAEFAARNLHFSFFKSEPENGGCLAKMDKTGETSEKVSQDNNEVNDLKNKAKGLKRDLDAAKFSSKVEKRPRIALDIDETREGVVRLLDQAKSFPEGTHPGCVSTSESSARVMISEDELESSSQQVGMSANFDRETLISPVGGVEGGTCDYASEFSIRDFVFAARNRDISQNWPFSEKNLQICLKHGVKHVLPPFKPVVSLRDSSIKRCLAGKILQSEESSLHEKQSMMRNHIVPGTIPELVCSWHQDLAEGYRDSDLFPSGGERDLAFKTNAAANSQSEMGSVSTSNLPLSEVSDEREAAGSAANNKTNSSASQLTRKKSKMAMKMRVNNKRNSPEDITSACTAPPETIYSQVCPVCESFSSPSNTTLNAHIDQCLSSQSPPIWMKSSKVMKPRIKPRKMRLMADICATAPCCTLEDLDRRNGTNWATNVDFPLEEADVPAERNNPGVSSRYLLNNADDDSVYIDSSGRKIRILSKFNDMPQSSFSKAREDLRPKKQSGKAKRSKFFSSNRKKRFAKHLMFLNVTRQRKRSFSLKVKGRSSDGCWPKEAVRTIGVRQQPTSFVKEAREQNHPGAVGSAKRCTSLLKNSDSEAITKFSRCEVQAAEESLIGSDQVGSAEVEPRTPVKKSMDFPKRFLSSTQSSLKTPAGVDQKSEGYSRGKMLGGRLLRGAVRENRDASQVSLNSGATQFNRKIGKVSRPISLDSTTAPLPLCEREADIQPNVVQNAAISFPATRGLLVSCHVGPSEGMKSCDLNTMLSPSRSCVHVCQANSDKLGSALDNSRDCKGDNEAEAWSGDISQQSGAVIDHPISCRITESLGRSSVVKVRQTQAMKYGQDVSNDSNSNDGLTDDICGNYGCVRSAIKVLHDDGEFIASASSSGLAIGVNETSLRTAFDPERERIADVSPQSKLLQCSDKFQGPLFRGQLGLNDSTETCEGNTGDAQRLDQKVGDYIPNFSHGSSFPEVDPIPIPGPPGSDLPSFSDMGSEDLHRSSLSSSLVQLSGDSDDVADGDLSECPFSAISAISNFGRSRTNDVTVNEQESVNVYPGWFDVGPRPLPGMSIVSSQITAAENERITRADNMEKGKVNLGGGGVMRNGDCQQRYCSQKDEITQSTMNSPDSRHLGWRLTTSTSFSVGSHSYSVLDGQSIGLNDRSAVFSASSYNRKESVNLANSVETSHQSIISLVNSAEAANLLPRAGNCDSTIPSAPVLRLMGKDLRVSNLVGADFSRSQADIDVGMNKLVKGSWEPESSQSPALIGSLHEQNPHYLPARHFDVGSSNVIHSFGSHNQASSDIYLNEHMHTSFSVLGAGPWQR